MAGHRATPRRYAKHEAHMAPVVQANPYGSRAERRAWRREHPPRPQTPEIREVHQWKEPEGWCVIHEAYDRPADWQPSQMRATGFPSSHDAGAAD